MSKELNLETTTPQEYRAWLKAEVKAGRLPKSELELFHVREEKKRIDGNLNVSMDVVLQKYNVREWGVDPSERQWDYYERMRTSGSGYGYTILFNPKDKDVDDGTDDGVGNAEAAATKPAKKGKKDKETISLTE